jgi:AraC-like DNA-binding protein
MRPRLAATFTAFALSFGAHAAVAAATPPSTVQNAICSPVYQADDAGESWLGALADPVVGPALHAVHADPTFQWTVDTMARAVGVSRAAFARRFRNAVGEPPLAYVTRWRMAVAAEFLERGERAARVAGRVGYDDEYAFAKAFKRVRGVSPGAHRRRYVKLATQPLAPDDAGRDTP